VGFAGGQKTEHQPFILAEEPRSLTEAR
jgi:hypothetical protein